MHLAGLRNVIVWVPFQACCCTANQLQLVGGLWQYWYTIRLKLRGSRDSSVVRVPGSWSKGHGFKPSWSSRRMFFSRVTFLCWFLFWCPFHPCVAAVAHKRSRSFCQKCRWQVTAKHACTLHMWLCMKWCDVVHGCMVCTERTETAAVSRGACRVTTRQRCLYTTSVDTQNAL